MKFTVQIGRAKTLKDINIRKGPSVAAVITSHAGAGQALDFIGFVSDGEKVSGNAKWFQMKDGNYFWSGNVEVLPDPPPVVAPNVNQITGTELRAIVPTLSVSKVSEYIPALNGAMQEFSINTPLRQCAFIAQTAHESAGYSAFVENLNYSAKALVATWPSRFTAETAAAYARKPEKIANRAYANRLGNGNESSGDGWRYRGRGVIQITGRSNYQACGTALGLDLLTLPELLEGIPAAFRSAAWFWNSKSLNTLADAGDFVGITKRINGGTNGLEDRLAYYGKAKTALGVV